MENNFMNESINKNNHSSIKNCTLKMRTEPENLSTNEVNSSNQSSENTENHSEEMNLTQNSSPSTDDTKPKMKRKRNRIPLSCTICRKRKVKCDKTRPHCDPCSKTGVAHLCHYMEQTWAEEAEKELSKENELQQLKERVKSLEKTIVKLRNQHEMINDNMDNDNIKDKEITVKRESLHIPSIAMTDGKMNKVTFKNDALLFKTSESVSKGQLSLSATNSNSKYANDELDLTRNFDMLHIKSTGTVHLGATHWLAIMKGDPYLKLLWGHIFSMREKLNEWYLKKNSAMIKNNNNLKSLQPLGRCPVINSEQKKLSLEDSSPNTNCNTEINASSNLNRTKILDITSTSKNRSLNSTKAPNKCPIDHTKYQELAITSKVNNQPITSASIQKSEEEKIPIIQMTSPKIIKNIPLESTNPLPSFHSLASKFPIVHDANNNINSSEVGKKKRKLNISDDASLNDSSIHMLSKDLTIKKVCDLLPPIDIIELYLNYFFNHIYPFIPILDESTFRDNTKIILGVCPVNNEKDTITNKISRVTKLKITKQADYCILGILLIILRITWLSLPSNSSKINLGDNDKVTTASKKASTGTNSQEKDECLLMKHEIKKEAINLVGKRLIRFDELSSISNNNVSLVTIQFAIFLKLYLMCCPNEANDLSISPISNTGNSQDNESHQVLLSSIIQMCLSCGLHRDPDNFPQLNSVTSNDSTLSTFSTDPTSLSNNQQSQTERFKHTWRKTWYYVVSLDVDQSLSLGIPRLLRNLNDFSDTKLPSASKLDYVSDIKELVIVKNYTLFFQIDLVIISVLNHILNISIAKKVKKHQLDSLIMSLKELTEGSKSIFAVISNLHDENLLNKSEGVIDNMNIDKNYGLSTMDELIYNNGIKSTKYDSDKYLENGHITATKALFFSKHMLIRMLLYIVSYILFTYYEPLGNENPETTIIAKEYAQKTLNYAMDGYKNCLLFFEKTGSSGCCNSIFNFMGVVLAPRCLDIGNRAIQFMICLIMRSKCGPLSGMGESTVLSTSGTNSNDDDTQNKVKEFKRTSLSVAKSFPNAELDINGNLTDILTSKMIVFHKLASQLSSKYPYANRNVKSTAFFLSLLAPETLKNEISKTSRDISKISGILKNVPSLLLSGDKDSLQRCPVYQDALGFVDNKPGKVSSLLNPSQTIQKSYSAGRYELPPLKSYMPVTYSNESSPQSTLDPEIKRRKIDAEATEFITNSINNISLPVLPSYQPNSNSSIGYQNANRNTDTVNQSMTMDSNPQINGFNSGIEFLDNMDQATSSSVNMENNPPNQNTVTQFAPDFEEFIAENSNFNGMVLNPNSLVEVFGMNLEDPAIPGNLGSTDFLPIDNIGFEGIADLDNSDFWSNADRNTMSYL
ncbi:hypothetical protein TPHA_0O00600 [Tetrapisispora phaffii CBS 4417]|uniref:Zn(2)-C6 fungal-type domain-containing protein n=1 Tax=Tetrapisispora phaffii (strain ATCC 24235 / CBS 4417 / NBRC 1672 / NRRL Y-8282 / UCD 70-5) TaxID=1071381 RepID=G8C1K2_TETPH|nr:hypothetical protein TPHA_0O00600 [Tetrapisispora phaffii CBS 4417]CCE66030.1 hypothetical protein TPHA_0O00600 [Tetrapisispora phaffii CBS 4417]